jgi:tRNA A37 threonylcarbamoyltransferase TsaD
MTLPAKLDKAPLLGLGYPAGEIEKHARGGDPNRFKLPHARLRRFQLQRSSKLPFVIYCRKLGSATTERLPIMCASFQQAVIDIAQNPQGRKESGPICDSSGGVSYNRALCSQLEQACRKRFAFRAARHMVIHR